MILETLRFLLAQILLALLRGATQCSVEKRSAQQALSV
jgi:hypothetical protein